MRWLLLLIATAWAHGGLPAGNDAFLVDGELVGGGMALGLMLVEDEGPRWVGSSAVGANVNGYHRRQDGSILALTFDGLFLSPDGGCTWQPLALGGRQVRRIRVVGDDPSHLVATLANNDMPGKLVESLDEGATWTDTGLAIDAFFPRQIELASSGWFVSGFGDDPVRQVTWRSLDQGQSWEEPPALAGRDVVLVGHSGARVFGSEAAGDGSVLLSSVDGFATAEIEGEIPLGRISDAAEIDGRRLVLVDGLETWAQEEGEALVPQEGGPSDCLGPVDGDLLWTCADVRRALGPFLRSADGISFDSPLSFDRICPRVCPEGSAGWRANGLDWSAAQELGLGLACEEDSAGDDDDSVPSPGDPGCSCEGGAPSATLLLLPLVGRRRRARSRSPDP